MHALVVISHPDRRSYTHQIASSLITGLTSPDNTTIPPPTYEIADLAAENFDPRFTAHDYDVASGAANPHPSILAEQERISRADVLILIFPIYWWSLPALLKGWINRVFHAGWAFRVDYESVSVEKKLTGLKGVFIGVGGITRGTYERRGYWGAMRTEIGQGVFDFCGMERGGEELVLPRYEAVEGLERVRALGARLAGEGK
ncbi:hypothetical protein M409DRAFT_22635 [Zasmidium cellare ATCC 36951]|uniref:Flavodoxin-like fold domain-containing protein n=1 Tax=Zasmidium cellare ATCC 36951 TaxID=1080233 RepID=A0A6A6CP02_ZASCE|nr:uncharacterized protein M409DRAFT_22635 [Zasmidium cellare ATCC 36951]KAF2167206.1 hypothetical protein M409DRAFT_22635 [Zasmidium cellare ATCC 36951]